MRRFARLVAVVAASWALVLGQAQDDPFAFMPAGGPQLLQQVLDACGECDGFAALAALDQDADAWRGYFEERGALGELEDHQVETLVRYLAVNLPAEGAQGVEDLPRGGREIAVVQCTVCHTIELPMTADRSVERWREHIRVPPHDAIGLSEAEWATLASYLALNAPVPEESIPEELRGGAGGY